MLQLFQKNNANVVDKLTFRVGEFQKVADIHRCFKPIQAVGFSAAVHAYQNALQLIDRYGLDATKEVYSSKQIFVPEFISRDISTILESGKGLFDIIDNLPGFLAREQKAKDETRALYNAKTSEERRAMKLKTKMALEEQARKRQEFTQATGVRVD